MAEGQIGFGNNPLATVEWTDEHYLRKVWWRRSADVRLVSAAGSGDVSKFSGVLRKLLRRQRKSAQRAQMTPALLQPLWSRHAFDKEETQDGHCGFVADIHQQVTSKKSDSKRASAVCKIVDRELQNGGPSADAPVALLAWMTVLAEVCSDLTDSLLCSLWRRTLDAAMQCQASGAVDSDDAADQRLLVLGEVPWRSGLLFSEVRGAGKLRKSGQSYLRQELEALTDGDGTPHARLLHRLPLTLAVLVRSMSAGQSNDLPLWDRNSSVRFDSLVERIASLCQADGRTAMSNGASFAPASLLKTATKLAGFNKRVPAAQRLLSLPDDSPQSGKTGSKQAHKVNRLKRVPRFDEDDSPSSQSDWAELACLRNNWHTGADSCVVTHHLSQPEICLTAFERLLINGDWRSEILRDGKQVEFDGEWSCVCWFSDKDADYLELQEDGNGVTLFRQVLLSRTDHWLFLADGVTCEDQSEITLTTRLPLAEGVTTESCRWTRELSISQGKLKARAYPLALDQQRVVSAHGSLTEDAGCLTLQQTMAGRGTYAPLVIDWSPDRRRSEARWRRLTVAEDGAVLSPDIAGGFRLQAGKHQWLFYRSFLPGETARTFLGHHTPHETVIGEFTTDGTVEPLVMVE